MPMLPAPLQIVMASRLAGYKVWGKVRNVLVGLLVVGAVIAVSGGVLALLALTTIAGFVGGTAAALAGILTVALAIVNRHVGRFEADIWGLMMLTALRSAGPPQASAPSKPLRP
jgi:hypothetical protein